MVGSDGCKEGIEKNDGIEVMGIIGKEYLSKGESGEKVKKGMKGEFEVMRCVGLVEYLSEVEGELESMGVGINGEMGEEGEGVVGE